MHHDDVKKAFISPNPASPVKQETTYSIVVDAAFPLSLWTISSMFIVVLLYFIAVEQAKLSLDIPPV